MSTPSARAEARRQITTYAREQHDLAHLQLDEAYTTPFASAARYDREEMLITATRSIAHSLAAITALLLAKEIK